MKTSKSLSAKKKISSLIRVNANEIECRHLLELAEDIREQINKKFELDMFSLRDAQKMSDIFTKYYLQFDNAEWITRDKEALTA